MEKRWINIAKGIGITLVVMGHSNISYPLIRYIQSFHMPLFFFISGYLYRKRDFWEFVKRKVNTLVVPYIKYSIIYLSIYLLLGYTLRDNIKFVLNTLFGTQDLLWFLVALFFTENIFNILKNLISKEKALACCIVGIGIVGHFLSYYGIILYYRIDIVMVAIVIFYSGYITFTYLRFNIGSKMLSIKIFIIAFSLNIIFCFLNNVKVDMKVGQYGNLILYYISALSGIYCIFYISLMIKKSFIMEFLGKNSMIIYAYNVFIPLTIKECIKILFKDQELNIVGKIIIKGLSYMIIFIAIIFDNYLKKRKIKDNNSFEFHEMKNDIANRLFERGVIMNRLTIFTATYNRAYTLQKLYTSLKLQTSKDFIWLIIDDGSTDNTIELVKDWINESLILIEYYKQENSGKSMAHNKGVELAKTELFTCVDSDDYLSYTAVEDILRCWNEKRNMGLIGILAYKVYGNNKSLTKLRDRNIEYSTLKNLYDRCGLTGDTMLIYSSLVIKKYHFPNYQNEKFVPEAYLYDLLDQEGELYILRIKMYICEYLEGGYSSNIATLLLKNHQGYFSFINQRIKLDKSLILKFNDSVRYDAMCIAMKKKKFISNAVYPILALIAYPLGILFYIIRYKEIK